MAAAPTSAVALLERGAVPRRTEPETQRGRADKASSRPAARPVCSERVHSNMDMPAGSVYGGVVQCCGFSKVRSKVCRATRSMQ